MAEFLSLSEAVEANVRDGKVVFSWGGNPGVGSPHRLLRERHARTALAHGEQAGVAG